MSRLTAFAWVALALAGCGGDDAAPGDASGTAGTQAGTGGQAGTSAGGTAGVPPCLPAPEPFGIDPDLGHSFPDVQLTSCDGKKQSLEEIRCAHALTLLSIGAGWCAPCKEETPDLQVVSDALADQGLGVVQVMFEDTQANPASTLFCKTWVETYSLAIPVFIDPAGNVLEPVGGVAIPVNVVLDHDGRVVWAINGVVPPDLLGTLQELLSAR